ncbi:unnamed protein product [Sphagnum balticum]
MCSSCSNMSAHLLLPINVSLSISGNRSSAVTWWRVASHSAAGRRLPIFSSAVCTKGLVSKRCCRSCCASVSSGGAKSAINNRESSCCCFSTSSSSSSSGSLFQPAAVKHERVTACSAVQNLGDLSVSQTDRDTAAKLKEELLYQASETVGNLSEESLALIAKLEKLNPYPEAREFPHLYNGCFEAVKSTLKQKGREERKDAGVFATTFTLGRVTFNAFKPLGQEVVITETYNHVGQASEDEYLIISKISVKVGEGEEPLEGLVVNAGTFSFVNPKDMEVVFASSTLRPLHPEKENDLRRWKEVFQEANPSMDERGFVTVQLPAAKGKLDLLYLDEEMRITRGNLGNVFVTNKLKQSAVSI